MESHKRDILDYIKSNSGVGGTFEGCYVAEAAAGTQIFMYNEEFPTDPLFILNYAAYSQKYTLASAFMNNPVDAATVAGLLCANCPVSVTGLGFYVDTKGEIFWGDVGYEKYMEDVAGNKEIDTPTPDLLN